jgi:hypothetical protein
VVFAWFVRKYSNHSFAACASIMTVTTRASNGKEKGELFATGDGVTESIIGTQSELLEDPVVEFSETEDPTVVTPEKPKQFTSIFNTSMDRTFYVINRETGTYFKYESHEAATCFIESSKLLDPSLSSKLLVHDFANDAELKVFIDKMKQSLAVASREAEPMPGSAGLKASRFFYVINKETHGYKQYQSKELAMQYFEDTKAMNPQSVENLLVQDFVSVDAMLAYVDALALMTGKSAAKNPFAKRPDVPAAVVNLPSNIEADKVTISGAAPSKRPKLAFASDKVVSGGDVHAKRFEDAMRNSNSKLDTFHMVLPGSEFDVWGFSLMENEDYYWSWKPPVLEKAIMAEQVNRLFEKEDTNMDEMLGYVRSAILRETPGGVNIGSSFTLKSGEKMDRCITWGLIPSPSGEAEVKEAMLKFCTQCKNVKIQMAYRVSMHLTMKAESIKKDVEEGGQLWQKLASAANNVVYRKINNLAMVLLDHTIEEIIGHTFGYSGGESPSMWDRRVYILAFGEHRVSESA